jgi:hypothetical protein
MELDLQSLFGIHVHSCTNSFLSTYLSVYLSACLCVSAILILPIYSIFEEVHVPRYLLMVNILQSGVKFFLFVNQEWGSFSGLYYWWQRQGGGRRCHRSG